VDRSVSYDGSRGAEVALAVARGIAETAPGSLARVDIAYVDDSASAACEFDDGVIDSRRAAVIEWWLTERIEQVSASVRPVRLLGDPAAELAELSDELDLLVIGSRQRAPLSRALTGSLSRRLIGQTRCPLLIVPARMGTHGARAEDGLRRGCVIATT
jgi:nucleotide-binding universal stress UspA family protein